MFLSYNIVQQIFQNVTAPIEQSKILTLYIFIVAFNIFKMERIDPAHSLIQMIQKPREMK